MALDRGMCRNLWGHTGVCKDVWGKFGCVGIRMEHKMETTVYC